MSLGQSKGGGIEFGTLIEALLILMTFVVIVMVFQIAASRADEKTQENLCRGFNAIRYGTQELTGFQIGPKACNTIDKKDVPSDNYENHVDGIQAGAQAEIRKLLTRCWWMWLEGNHRDMFETSTLSIKEKCFMCYTFSLDKKAESISYQQLSASLSEPYYAVDGTDRCAPASQGGWCMDDCNLEFPKEVPSTKCNPQISGFLETGERVIESTSASKRTEQEKNLESLRTRKCCISESECESKGGKCLDEPNKDYTIYYNNWKCKSNDDCYIKPEKSASYLDYIQGTKGVQGGAGKVLFADNAGFNPGQKYAITFLSPGKEWNPATLVGIGATGTTIYWAGGLIASFFTGGAVTIAQVALAGGLTSASYYFTSQHTGSINDMNYIMISKYDTAKNHCAVEVGAGER